MVKVVASLGVGISLVGGALPALADDIRPAGFLERGTLEHSEGVGTFVPDSQGGMSGGRYFRVGGYDSTVFYGLGSEPTLDWVWPSYRARSGLKELLRVAPSSLNVLQRYEDGQEVAQNWARFGTLVAAGGLLASLGGLGYSLVPSNPREMTPGFYFAAGGVAALGLAMLGGATLVAQDNQALLNRAIANYNRDTPALRKLSQPPSRP